MAFKYEVTFHPNGILEIKEIVETPPDITGHKEKPQETIKKYIWENVDGKMHVREANDEEIARKEKENGLLITSYGLETTINPIIPVPPNNIAFEAKSDNAAQQLTYDNALKKALGNLNAELSLTKTSPLPRDEIEALIRLNKEKIEKTELDRNGYIHRPDLYQKEIDEFNQTIAELTRNNNYYTALLSSPAATLSAQTPANVHTVEGSSAAAASAPSAASSSADEAISNATKFFNTDPVAAISALNNLDRDGYQIPIINIDSAKILQTGNSYHIEINYAKEGTLPPDRKLIVIYKDHLDALSTAYKNIHQAQSAATVSVPHAPASESASTPTPAPLPTPVSASVSPPPPSPHAVDAGHGGVSSAPTSAAPPKPSQAPKVTPTTVTSPVTDSGATVDKSDTKTVPVSPTPAIAAANKAAAVVSTPSPAPAVSSANTTPAAAAVVTPSPAPTAAAAVPPAAAVASSSPATPAAVVTSSSAAATTSPKTGSAVSSPPAPNSASAPATAVASAAAMSETSAKKSTVIPPAEVIAKVSATGSKTIDASSAAGYTPHPTKEEKAEEKRAKAADKKTLEEMEKIAEKNGYKINKINDKENGENKFTANKIIDGKPVSFTATPRQVSSKNTSEENLTAMADTIAQAYIAKYKQAQESHKPFNEKINVNITPPNAEKEKFFTAKIEEAVNKLKAAEPTLTSLPPLNPIAIKPTAPALEAGIGKTPTPPASPSPHIMGAKAG